MAQEADAQAEEEAQEDARQVQVDLRCDLLLDGNGGDGNRGDGSGALTSKAHRKNMLTLAFSRRINVSSRIAKHHPASPEAVVQFVCIELVQYMENFLEIDSTSPRYYSSTHA